MREVIASLIKNNMQAHFLGGKSEVVPYLQKVMPESSKVGIGGSVSLAECGVIEFLNNAAYVLNADDNKSDFYLCSSNAITKNGLLYNIDGRSNRISCIVHGPKNVIIVAGKNKIVENLQQAVYRIKSIAAPRNCKRLNFNTPCVSAGKCVSLNRSNASMEDGCESQERSCCNYLISGAQRIKNRITVLLVNENMGY